MGRLDDFCVDALSVAHEVGHCADRSLDSRDADWRAGLGDEEPDDVPPLRLRARAKSRADSFAALVVAAWPGGADAAEAFSDPRVLASVRRTRMAGQMGVPLSSASLAIEYYTWPAMDAAVAVARSMA